MKFKRIQEPGNRTGYEAVLSEYDSIPPSNKVIIDELPEKIDPVSYTHLTLPTNREV